jgi:hypothetical protein
MNRQLLGSAMKTPVGVPSYPWYTFAFVCKEGETLCGVKVDYLYYFSKYHGLLRA